MGDSLGSPVPGAEVIVLERGIAVSSTTTGEFELTGVRVGVIHVRVRHPRFQAWSDSLTIVKDTTLRIRLLPTAQPLPGVRVSGAAERLASPLLADFRRRRESANGRFLTADELEKIGAQSLANVVRGHIGGFDLVRHPSGIGTAFASRRAAAPRSILRQGPNECYSNIWVNGQLIYYVSPVRQDPPRVEDFEIHSITALEFYRSASETPIELNVMSAACGTVVIWTEIK